MICYTLLMKKNKGFTSLDYILQNKQTQKPPAYQWQDLALRVITELRIPKFKHSAVFKVCKERGQTIIEQTLNDTKELCPNGQSWKYFFKILGNQNK